jgi:peptidyl-dipeptidase Dcp
MQHAVDPTLASAPRAAERQRANPLLTASTLPYEAPRFDEIEEGDFQPALEEGMRQHLAEVERVAGQAAEPTFENTIVALERSGALLTRALKAFSALTGANTNPTLQRIEAEEAPRLAAHSDAVYLNDRLFRRVERVHEQRDALSLAAEERALVERYHRDFVRAGARLPEAEKTRLSALNQEEATLTTEFTNRLLAANRAGALVVDDAAELAGLTEREVAAAAKAAEQRGLAGKWVLPLQNTTQQQAQASLADRLVRERLFAASTGRAERGGPHDTGELVRRLAQLRAERARLLGFPSYAAYGLDDQMARTPSAAAALLTALVPPATAKARAEAAKMQAMIDREGGGFTLAPWDWQYYAEQVRRAEYDLDESQLKPYFALDRVLRDGVFYAATLLYGLTFEPRHDIPVYHPDVRVWEVFDADGSPLALFYTDFYAREEKRGGAWMTTFVDQSGLLGTRPVVVNVCNFTKPAPGQPALVSFDEVNTLFHEFGHALHGMLSRVVYPTLSGTNVPRDFVELPSQFNEHWALDPVVFANYAKHYETGAPMPQALVERIRRARAFNQGFATTEYLAAALLDLAWHDLPPDAPPQDVAAFERAALDRAGVALPTVPPRYRTTYFAHVWGGDYAASYYAYMWAEVLDHDAFAWFTEHGGLTRENGQRFRDMILSCGGAAEPGAMYRAFRGRDPSVEPLLAYRGLDSGEAAAGAAVDR